MRTIFVSSLNLKNADIQATDCILFSCMNDNRLFLLFDEYTKKQNVLDYYFNKTNQIIYFGGQTEFRILSNFGAINSEFNTIDLNARYWNLDTTKTNKNYLDALEQLEIINSEQRVAIELFLVYTYKHVSSGFVVIEENIESDLYLNARRIIYGMKLIYQHHNTPIFADILDDSLSCSLMKIEDNKIRLDSKYVKHIKSDIDSKIEETINDIYGIAGKRFNINSTRELNFILREQGISIEALSKNALESNYEQTGIILFKLIERYRKLTMYREQYVKPLYESSCSNGFGRFKYKTTSVPCLTQGHFCFVKDKGIVDISEVEKDDLIWTEYGFKKVLWAESHRTKDLTRVSFSNGITITGTSHHPVLVNIANHEKSQFHSIIREWVSLECLYVGENVICNNNYSVLKSECSEHYFFIGETICNIINTYINYNNDYVMLENIRFSHVFSFEKFKSCCEFIGLKFWGFNDIGKETTNHYNIVFYDEISLLNFYTDFRNQLKPQAKSIIESFLKKQDRTDFNYEYNHPKNTGYFNLLYEETTVVSVEKISTEMTVYDIEVEDIHEYNASGIINHNTGRLASSRSSSKNNYFTHLNIQSVPKILSDNINVRKCFLPNDNCNWCCIDFKAQEMRLASYLYGLKKINTIPLNEDIYTEFGKELNLFDNTDLSDHIKREASKVICLGMIYGLSNYGIVRQLSSLGIDVDESHDFRQSFYDICPELREGQYRTLKYAHAVNGIYTISGRFRQIKFTSNDYDNLLSRNNRIALNTVIQGACGDIMRIVLNKVEKEIEPRYKEYGFALLSTIHDEINISIPKSESLFNEILKEIISIITKPIDQLQDLRFGCSVSIGESWGALSPINI